MNRHSIVHTRKCNYNSKINFLLFFPIFRYILECKKTYLVDIAICSSTNKNVNERNPCITKCMNSFLKKSLIIGFPLGCWCVQCFQVSTSTIASFQFWNGMHRLVFSIPLTFIILFLGETLTQIAVLGFSIELRRSRLVYQNENLTADVHKW